MSLLFRPFLFLAGEYTVSMPVVFQKDNWQHSMSAQYLDFTDNKLHRRNRNEDIKGIIYYTDLNNKEMQKHNLNSIVESNVSYYPDPSFIDPFLHRHEQHRDLIKIPGIDNNPGDYFYNCSSYKDQNYKLLANFVKHKFTIGKFNRPMVLKTSESHRGDSKYLLYGPDDCLKVQPFDGEFTLGPYYTGDSVRVLFIEDMYFVVEAKNDKSWIKNSEGADVLEYKDYDPRLIEHAKKIKDKSCLDIVGVDYIVNKPNNKIYFLEANCFPGLNISDECVALAKDFFRKKIENIENRASLK